jgi:hypothetical protein
MSTSCSAYLQYSISRSCRGLDFVFCFVQFVLTLQRNSFSLYSLRSLHKLIRSIPLIGGDGICPFSVRSLDRTSTMLQRCSQRWGMQRSSSVNVDAWIGDLARKINIVAQRKQSYELKLHCKPRFGARRVMVPWYDLVFLVVELDRSVSRGIFVLTMQFNSKRFRSSLSISCTYSWWFTISFQHWTMYIYRLQARSDPEHTMDRWYEAIHL